MLGLDLGSKRVGVAVSDAGEVLASPLLTLVRTGDPRRDHGAIAALVAEEGAECVVVGLPLSLDGTDGTAARTARVEAEALATALPVPVVLHDERLTTVEAHRRLAERGLDERARRKVVDQVAAAVMLQAWLDERRARAGREDQHG